MVNDRAILEQIERQPNRTAGYKQLIREMSLRGNERQQLAERLQALVKSGKLIEIDRSRYTLTEHATARHNLIAGRLTMHRDGYGFVVPHSGQRTKSEGDIFIPPPAIGPAMHGDQVLVELARGREEGRPEGKILRVLSRGNPTIVGIFHHGSRNNYVTPLDEKVTQDVVIAAGMERPAGAEGSAEDSSTTTRSAKRSVSKKPLDRDRVYDAAVRRRQSADMEGLVVDVEITEWPAATQNPRGRVVEIVGYEDDFGVDVEIVIRKHHLPHRFPVDVLQEAQQYEAVIPALELRHRHDYRNLPIVTIDGETARDFDDAVTVRRTSNGNFELQVHIADVAHYVREGSAIDLEARLRGTSVYFPDRAIPMLPMELSTDLCSLRPQVERLVLSCAMEIDHQGEIVAFKLNEGVIRSAERMTYTNVNLILEGDPAQRQHYHALVDVFELMRELAMVLNRKRVRRGSIDFDLPEPVIEFDENGLMKSVTRSERNIAHRIIEEFMLAANECVATYLEQKDVASLYRIHEKPDPKRVYDFETIAAKFGYSLGVGPLPVKRVQMKADRRDRYSSGRQTRTVEIPEEVHITPRMYQKLTQKIVGKTEERILSYLMLRSLKQARYSEINEGHFALAAPSYTHFTSPIRRYPDLIVHRVLKEVLRDGAEGEEHGVPVGSGALAHSEAPSPWSKRDAARPSDKKQARAERNHRGALHGPLPEQELHDIADDTSQSERRAADAERELMEWKKAKFMEQHVGEEFDGLIVSVTKFGMFVELSELFVEGLVPLVSMTDDHYLYHENTRPIIGQHSRRTYSMGDPIRVLVDRIDHTQRRVIFAIAEEREALDEEEGSAETKVSLATAQRGFSGIYNTRSMRCILALSIALSFAIFACAQSASPQAPTQATPQPSAVRATAAASTPGWPTAQFAATKDPSVQKAKQVLDDMIRALGGETFLNIRTMTTEGRSYSFWKGQPSGMGLVFWRFWEWPDKERVELTKQRDVTELYIGDKGYEITYKGTATQDPKLVDDYLRRRDHSLETVVRKWLAAPGTMILFSGTAIVEQNMAEEVTVLNGVNDSVTISVDPRSHLPVRKTFSYRDPLDRMKDDDTEIFSNYRTVQGVATPYSTVRLQNGEMRNQRFITNVAYNPELSPTLFETKGITYNPEKSAAKPQ